ncbi:hypothetical protein, partial [Methanosarcina sp. UBA5]|uniref:hypothetical protein n=1 Tax=Methanosarcina sp. UBA5 TaxID=1915593 RepID=UPI0025F5DB1F
MLKMKKILGILLAFCFVLSVTAAAASAAPDNNRYNDKNKYNDNNKYNDKHKYNDNNKYNDKHKYDNKNKYNDNHYGKKKYQMKGHWGYKKVKHNKD